MKKNVTYVAREKFLELATDLGIHAKEQAGFIKLAGPKGRQVYVANTKNVGRVDISGFEVRDLPDFKDQVVYLGGEAFGAVKEQLNMATSRTEEEILASFAHLLGHMLTLDAVVKEKKGKVAKKEAAPLSDEEKKAASVRKAKLLVEVAKRTKKPLNKEAAALVASCEAEGLI